MKAKMKTLMKISTKMKTTNKETMKKKKTRCLEEKTWKTLTSEKKMAKKKKRWKWGAKVSNRVRVMKVIRSRRKRRRETQYSQTMKNSLTCLKPKRQIKQTQKVSRRCSRNTKLATKGSMTKREANNQPPSSAESECHNNELSLESASLSLVT